MVKIAVEKPRLTISITRANLDLIRKHIKPPIPRQAGVRSGKHFEEYKDYTL